MMMKLRTYAKKVGHMRANEAGVGSCGAFNSKTMMVMRIAITPSLNASIRFVLMHLNLARKRRKTAARLRAAGPRFMKDADPSLCDRARLPALRPRFQLQ